MSLDEMMNYFLQHLQNVEQRKQTYGSIVKKLYLELNNFDNSKGLFDEMKELLNASNENNNNFQLIADLRIEDYTNGENDN